MKFAIFAVLSLMLLQTFARADALSLSDYAGTFVQPSGNNNGSYGCPGTITITAAQGKGVSVQPDPFGYQLPVAEGNFCEDDARNPLGREDAPHVRHCHVLKLDKEGFTLKQIRQEKEGRFKPLATVATEVAEFEFNSEKRVLWVKRYGDASNSPKIQCVYTRSFMPTQPSRPW